MERSQPRPLAQLVPAEDHATLLAPMPHGGMIIVASGDPAIGHEVAAAVVEARADLRQGYWMTLESTACFALPVRRANGSVVFQSYVDGTASSAILARRARELAYLQPATSAIERGALFAGLLAEDASTDDLAIEAFRLVVASGNTVVATVELPVSSVGEEGLREAVMKWIQRAVSSAFPSDGQALISEHLHHIVAAARSER